MTKCLENFYYSERLLKSVLSVLGLTSIYLELYLFLCCHTVAKL